MSNFYIYVYLDQAGTPFYIGKGKNDRYQIIHHIQKSCSNRLLKNKILKVGIDNVQIKFLHTNLSEEEAFQFEIFYIELYGRRDLGLGPLVNLTSGGDGVSGYHHSDVVKDKMSVSKKGKVGHNHTVETRLQMSIDRKGTQPRLGTTQSEETRLKISIARKGRISNRKGVRLTAATKEKLRIASTGRILSESARQKISAARKEWWKNQRTAETSL